MLKYNLKLAIRNSKKHRKFFLISILSLAIGTATSSLLWFHVKYEKSYDTFYKQTDNLFRVSYTVNQGGKQIINSCRTQSALSPVLPKETDLIEGSCRAYYEDCYMYTEDVKLYNQQVIWADSGFLNVFQNEMVLGDPSTALANKYSVVISDKTAQIYFGQSDPMGKVIKLNEGMVFTVTGVFKEIPQNSHLRYNFITSFSTLEDYGMPRQGNWRAHFVGTYIRKKEDVSKAQIETVLADIVDKYMADRTERGQEAKLTLIPVKDIYLHSDLEGEFKPLGNSNKLSLLTIIALFVIIIAWANNVNIATALSFERAKESGIRKLNGASKKSLFKYFITESFFINLVSVFLSLIILQLLFPAFKALVDDAVVKNFFLQYWFWGSIVIFMIAGVLFTGVFPAIVQSSFTPLQVLKKYTGGKTSLNSFRTNLVVFQFTLAIILIGSTLLIFKQIKHLETQDLGIKANQVLVMRAPATNNTTGDRRYAEFRSFRQELLQAPHIKSVTATMNVPGQMNRYNNVLVTRNTKQIDASFNISQADENYFETYQVPIIEGRNFYTNMENERGNIIINKKAAEALEFETAGEAIGQKITVGNSEREIVGVVKNFHHESLKKELEPYIYTFNHPGEFGYYPALIATNNIPGVIGTVEKIWKNHYPNALFDYFFLDEFFNKQYVTYRQLGKLVGISSCLAILIACLGLFALASYTVNKKIKEIGVRKVNGAKVRQLLAMLNAEFIKWVVIAFVVATPVAWYAMKRWLENFAYKTNLSWWIFALAGFIAMVVAVGTVSWKSWKAANRNPVEALKYE